MTTAGSEPRRPARAVTLRAAATDTSGNSGWPVAPLALAALLDLGVGEAAIARYFGVRVDDVQSLRLAYGLA